MIEETVEFYSDGDRVQGILRRPENGDQASLPVIVHSPGWMSLKDAAHYRTEHEHLTNAGFSVLIFDYRGFGDSEGERGWIRPLDQVADVIAAVSYLGSRLEFGHQRIGVLGSGGTGGGVAIYAAAVDQRIQCVSAMFPVADGREWLASMRRPYEWNAFLQGLEENRRRVASGGFDREVDPFSELMIAAPERRQSGFKKDIAHRLPHSLRLSTVDHILWFMPEAVVDKIAPRAVQLIAARNDVVVPHSHAERLFSRAGSPKRLVLLENTNSYIARSTHVREIEQYNVEWFTQHLKEISAVHSVSS